MTQISSACNEVLADIIRVGRSLFAPRQKQLVSAWAEENRYVTREESARPGQWDNSVTPFAVEIMDAWVDPEVEEITCMFSAQVVKTEIIKNCVGYVINQQPAPVLIVYPTDGDARDFSTEKLEPMIRGNACLNSKVAPEKSNSKDNKTLYKKFDGGFVAIAGGRVPQELARRSVKYVIADDRDRITLAGAEGDAVALAWQRTESYALFGRKKLECSTPTIKGRSPIEKSYQATDQREYYVPCPFCGTYQTLKFDNVVWEKEKDFFGKTIKHLPETAAIKCSAGYRLIKKESDNLFDEPETEREWSDGCGELIEEKHKSWMISNGFWLAKNPEEKKKRGYKLNRLYSTFSRWSQMAEWFLDVKDDAMGLQVFINTGLGESFELEEAEQIDETGMLERVENYNTDEQPKIPNDIVLLTCAIDTQPDRLEVQVQGWGAGEETWVIHYEKLWGDIDKQDLRAELDQFLERRWTREDGVTLGLGTKINGRQYKAVFIDSGGHNTQAVYEYCRARQHKGVIAIKGRAGALPVLVNKTFVGKDKTTILYNLGVDSIKQIIWKRLARTTVIEGKVVNGAGLCHFTREFCDDIYFKSLLAERPYKGYDKSNGAKIIWKKYSTSARNEPWDLMVYNYAAMKSCMAAGDRTFVKLKEVTDKKAEAVKETVVSEPTEKNKPAAEPVNKKKIKVKRQLTGFRRY